MLHPGILGQLLVGLLCAALYPQVIAIEREETKKKKGLNAPIKLRIRDRNEDGTGCSDPTEVALHPSSVNAKETNFSSPYLIYHEKVTPCHSRLDSARLDSTRLDSTRLDSTSTRLDST